MYYTNAVAFAQVFLDILALETAHADCFYGPIFCTRELTQREEEEAYVVYVEKAIMKIYKR